jgi:hypothetical protein
VTSWDKLPNRTGEESLGRSLTCLGPVAALFLAHAWLFRRFFADDSFIVFRLVSSGFTATARCSTWESGWRRHTNFTVTILLVNDLGFIELCQPVRASELRGLSVGRELE